MKDNKKKKKNSVQELIGIDTFSKRGLKTRNGELVFFSISPTNISVLSKENIQTKIWHLMMVLSAQPDIEITCLDSCERFDDNKSFMVERLEEEVNPRVRQCLERDIEYLDNIQIEMSTARQFMFVVRSSGKRTNRYSRRSTESRKPSPSRALKLKECARTISNAFLPSTSAPPCRVS